MSRKGISRRKALGILGAAAVVSGSIPAIQGVSAKDRNRLQVVSDKDRNRLVPIGMVPVHGVDPAQIKFRTKAPLTQSPGSMDPMTYLEHFDYGKTTSLPDGTTLREYRLAIVPLDIEVATDIVFPAWTFNGTAPGPTLRAVEGDRMKITLVNGDTRSHTIHFHGIHPADMDGVFETVPPGGSFLYDFIAKPFGLFPYHCHTLPLKKHIMKGLYGSMIIDPRTPRPPAREMVMVMNGFDLDFDGENEFYTINGIANYYLENPINIRVGEKIRIYLSNMTEFDLINSFHLHANMFHYYPNGTMLEPTEFTDTIMLCQGQRGILEFTYNEPGQYLVHAHQSEFAELGWIGIFDVKP